MTNTYMNELLEKNTGDPRQRLELGQQILETFNERGLPSDSMLLTKFSDVLVQWLNGSNYKVALLALDILDVALGVSGGLLAPYLLDNTDALMERMGHSKEQVRQQAIELIIKLMHVPHSSPQLVFERLIGGFTHKQWLVRIGVMHVLIHVLKLFGPGAINISKSVPLACRLVTDQNAQVRDKAMDLLCELYICNGDALTKEIQKKRLISDAKLPAIMVRFDEVKRSGLVSAQGVPVQRQQPYQQVPQATFKPAPSRLHRLNEHYASAAGSSNSLSHALPSSC